MDYQRANFKPMHDTVYGIGFHWTTWTYPEKGEQKPFDEAVKNFDVDAFVRQAVEAGAGHVMITATHELHWLPGPNEEVDRILPGRTCERDLIMEIANKLADEGIALMLYYNHGTDTKYSQQDPKWQDAVGSTLYDRTRYFDNYCKILRWMGRHYGRKVFAYWFDSAWAHAKYPNTPWVEFTEAAKEGHPERLVCYNMGIEDHNLATANQDYWSGELNRLNYYPREPMTPSGLPWYSLVAWHPNNTRTSDWGINKNNVNTLWLPPTVDSVAEYIRRFHNVGGAVTINLLCYQNGKVLECDMQVMREVKKIIREGG